MNLPAAPVILNGTPVRAWWTGPGDGDQRGLVAGQPAPPPVPDGRILHRLTQVHGAHVVVVGADGASEVPSEVPTRVSSEGPPAGDALVSVGVADCLAVLTADCAAVALGSPEGVHAAVHVGWRGLAAGVVQAAAAAARRLGAGSLTAAVGPRIDSCCYQFGPVELDALAARYGDEVRAETSSGAPALDLLAGLRAALAEAVVGEPAVHGGCTACDPALFSYRRAGDVARHALLVWRAAGS